MSLLGLVLTVIVLFVLIWAVIALADAFSIPPQIKIVVLVLIVVLFVIWMVQALGGFAPGPLLRR